jgi:pimeloyl-ACP methyl ester carboxylesterase
MTSTPRIRLAIAFLAFLAGGASAIAQAPKKPPEPPKPLPISFQTEDGVDIVGTYYGSNNGKETIPVILLHEYGGSGADFKVLAQSLQSAGFAVLVPDLRGHGGSTKTNKGRDLDHKKMPPKLCHGIYMKDGDLDKCKQFLIRENNQEKLNIDKLCLIGAGLGGTLGLNWAAIDWSWTPVGGVKQGQDVKAVIMLSPPFSEKTVAVTTALRSPAILKEIAIYIMAGQTGKPGDDAKKIHKPIDVARGGTEGEELKKQLLMQTFETSRQGTQLLLAAELKVADRIKAFIGETVGKKTLPWKERKSPFD